jgi:membrane-associated protein
VKLFDPKHLIETWGTVGLLLVVFIESGLLPVPLPGDSLLFLAGLFASTSSNSKDPHLNLAVVVFGSLVLAFLGAQIGYAIGARYGVRIFRADARIFKTKYLEQGQEFFDRTGPKAVVIARFIPLVRTVVPILAGTSRMRQRAFATANAIGAVLWAVGISLLGYFVGGAIGEKNVSKYDYAIVAVIIVISLIPPLLEWRRHRRTRTSG